MNVRFGWTAAAAAVVLTVALTHFGCGRNTEAQSIPAALTPTPWPRAISRVVIAVDRSDSTADRRGEMLEALDNLASDADAAGVPIDLWVFDTQPARIWGPGLAESSNALVEVKRRELLPDPSHPRRGTRPGLLLTALTQDREMADLAPDRRVTLVVLTDGGIDHTDDPGLMKTAARTLAATHPRIEIRVIGIDSQARRTWDRTVGAHLTAFRAVTWSETESALTGIFEEKP